MMVDLTHNPLLGAFGKPPDQEDINEVYPNLF